MSAETFISTPFAVVDSSVRYFADRLAEELQLERCRVVPEAKSVTLRTVPMGKSRFIFVDSKFDLNLEARVKGSTSIIWVTLNGSVNVQRAGHEPVHCTKWIGCIWPASSDIRIETTAEYAALVIRMDHTVLEHELSRLLGHPIRAPLTFCAELRFDTPENFLGPLIEFICGTSNHENGNLLKSEILASAVETLFLDALLTTQKNNYTDAINSLNASIVPRHLKAAMRAIRANPEKPWRLSDMAREGGVSVRTICDSFHKFCASTPKQFLLTVRLAKAREEIERTTKSTPIAQIARQCGFMHPGRFAALYHRVYGEAPSETIRRMDEPAVAQ